MITAGSLYNNVKNWTFRVSGKISFDEAEKDVLLDALERNVPATAEIRYINPKVNDDYIRVCPKCGADVDIRLPDPVFANYCHNCGQRIIRPKEEANEGKTNSV